MAGLFHPVTELTQAILATRRLKTLQELADRTANAKTVTEACGLIADALDGHELDLPFLQLYLVDRDGRQARLMSTTGVDPANAAGSQFVDLASETGQWPLGEAVRTGQPVEVVDLARRGIVSCRPYPEPPTRAFILPLRAAGWEHPAALLVAGVSARRPLDEPYRAFYMLLRESVTTALGNARAHEAESARAEALAEIDRAKTTFFSNVSHEFRTPLTLMLGPTEEALASPERALTGESLAIVHRNELRLLKLVNTLLEFSRIEAGRAQATYEPVDLAELTTDLASAFESAIAQAGLRFEVECPPLARPFYVDRDMWEKIVLNLLSNALKFTFDGTIRVVLREREGQAELEIADTGAASYVEEALRWLPTDQAASAPITTSPRADGMATEPSVRVVLADDNADMRDYVRRILGERWTVDVFGDGQSALDAVRANPPDVVVADVMMPGLDGFGLLRELRHNPVTKSVPVIMLSARAGEEARIDGLQAGADDYLAKPFSARELRARVEAQILRAQIRSVEEAHDRRLVNVFQQAPVGIAILKGPAHVFDFVNEPYLDLIGHRPVLGKGIREALPELAGQGVYELLDDGYRSGRPFVADSLRVVLNRGLESAPEEAFYKFVYQPMLDEQGAVDGVAVVVTDVTDLVSARRDAESASRAKDEFIAMLSHELRNPLSPIITALQLMRLRGVDGAERERAIIERQVKHLVGLVDDLLDVSRITTGKVELNRAPVELAEIIAQAVEMMSPLLEQRRHALAIDVARQGLSIDADSDRLAQVVANLLTNAAKYTEPEGDIRLAAARDGDSVVLTVRDNGVGIEADLLPKVFDLFAQAQQAPDRARGGLGLGLAIVRSLVTLHGGTVSVASEGRARGSAFTVRLPFAPMPHHQDHGQGFLPEAHPRAEKGSRVLIVDDNADSAEMFAAALTALGFDTRIALDGPSALDIAKAFQPDVALLDIGLPVMDGHELARRLHSEPGERPIRLVAVTGYGQRGDRLASTDAGFDAHLVKPVDVAELAQLVTRLTRPSGIV